MKQDLNKNNKKIEMNPNMPKHAYEMIRNKAHHKAHHAI